MDLLLAPGLADSLASAALIGQLHKRLYPDFATLTIVLSLKSFSINNVKSLDRFVKDGVKL
jgi:hypothetical protein